MPEGARIGIVGAASLVGKEIIGVLGQRSVLVRDLVLLSLDPEEEGALAEGISEPSFIRLLDEEALKDLDLVFFCGRASQMRELIELRSDLGFFAIDLSDRDEPVEGPRILAGTAGVPEGADLVVSPHPVSVAAGLILIALGGLFDIRSYRLGVIQPASEHGQEGIDEMYEQTLAVLNVQSTPRDVFGQQVAFNLYTPENAAMIEREVSREILEVTGIGGVVMVQQGGIFHSHTLAMFISSDDLLDEKVIREGLQRVEYLSVREPEDLAGTSDAGGLDEIIIGRLSVSESEPSDLVVQAFSDNLRRSRAINAVMIAEQFLEGNTVTN